MKRGCVIGYDINEKGCQISYYDDSMEEPDTMMASSNNYLIPLVLGYFKDPLGIWKRGKKTGGRRRRLHGDGPLWKGKAPRESKPFRQDL